MMDTISQYLLPATQGLLILALFGVAILFVRLDGKLNAMKKGTDGVRDTIIELNTALAKAQMAMNDLKAASDKTSAELAKKIQEADAAKEALAFAASTAKALGADTQFSRKDSLPPRANSAAHYERDNFANAERPTRARFDDLPPIDTKRRTEWGGLR